MLIENTLFGVIDKVADAIARIQFHEPKEGYFVAFSGGKDSVVILDLIKKSGVKYDAHYHLTTVDPPELVRFIRKYHPEVEIVKPKMSMCKLIIHRKSPPTFKARYCCEKLKEGGGVGRFVITGVRWEESVRRSRRTMVDTCIKSRKHYLHPIIDWLSDDVWEYIQDNRLDYCCLYDEGFTRIGCIGCPNGGEAGMRRDFERWPKYRAMYIRTFQKMLIASRDAGLLRETWKNPEAVLAWWMRRAVRKDKDQTTLFE